MKAHPARAVRIVKGHALLVALALALAGAACGGAAPAKAPRAATDENLRAEPRTIEEAQEWIARERAALEGEAGSAAKATVEQSPANERRMAPAEPQSGAGQGGHHDRDGTCGGPCRALASMKRAVEALCRMTGDTDHRCVEARHTLDDSASRVASCRCEGP